MTRQGTHNRNPMELSLSEAARVAGKSKSTINRSIKSGKLSATRHDDGSYSIAGAELARAFPGLGSKEPSNNAERNLIGTHAEPPQQTEIRLLREQLDAERDTVRDLRTRLDASEAERREVQARVTALLASPKEAEQAPSRRSWWPWSK